MSGPADRHAFVKPPRAARQPKVDTWHGVELVDDYAWLKAGNWQEVMREPSVLDADIRAYLDAENAYCEAQLAETLPLQEDLFREMRGRLKEDDASVPAPDGPYAYYTGFVAGGQYPVVRRQAAVGGEADRVTVVGLGRVKVGCPQVHVSDDCAGRKRGADVAGWA